MSTPPSATAEAPVPDAPAKQPRDRQGQGAKQKKRNNFNNRKNKQEQKQITETLLQRLKIKDPTNVEDVKISETVVPSRVPVVLRGIPIVVHDLWERMKAIGTRPFAIIAQDPESYAVFMKVILLLFEAKVCWAQRTLGNRPRFELPTQFVFTEMMLRRIRTVSNELPFPIAIALESLGNFLVDGQPVVPVFATHSNSVISGAVSFQLTKIADLVQHFGQPIALEPAVHEVAQELQELPNFTWVVNQLNNTVTLTPETRAFWGNPDILPQHEIDVFLKIIASMKSKSGFIINVDIQTGDGSTVPLIRFPELWDDEESETLFYFNATPNDYSKKLAPALMFGYEHNFASYSRFCGNYDEPLSHGSACRAEARRALIWADKQ